ncbi:MAG: gliding motility-associated protein GldE [Bacteroidetes bacterium]|uniref:Gliding motility-associated protein GldE n=1 Tax=Candidatus Gallipaludibacter merdavium TaxID=2840839 RepID=A0A9D9HUL4_9BACT|nr:gliding motility-associated protein GldE [Candidatus Gallipaludibacter merdavium]
MDPDNFSPVLLGIISSQPLSFSAYVSLILGILLLFCSAFVSASEVAFFSLEPQDVDELRQKESANASKVLKLLEYPQKLLATILISNNFVNVAIIILITYFSTSLFDFSMAPIWGFVIQTIVITFLLLLFGEIMPKVYATQYPMKMALFAASTLLTLEKVLSPFVALLVKSSAIMNTDKVKTRNNISMDELSQALELTSDTEEDEKDMLEGIIKFGNIQVADIMRSRVDIVSVEIKSSYKELMRVIVESGYSRIPVFAENHDNIKGLIYSKDLLPHLEKPDNFRWQTLIRPAYFVPESKKIDDLLKEFQETKVHLAIVVDEYGGTSGLVTLEDILEEIVGDISDEYDDEEKLYVKVDDDTYVFEGKILLNDFYKITDIDESVFEKVTEDVETLAGLVLELKGEIPKKGDKVNMGPYEFEVVAVDNRRINKIRFHVNEEARKTEEE